MKKLGRSEARRFWEVRDSYWAESDYDDDPDALRNVLIGGQPLWFNRPRARYQEMAYQALFSLLPPPMPGARALDIGCGAGRWCRFLSNRGYHTVGIDLQPELIQANRHRYQHIDFLCTAVEDYSPQEPFDLVSSVTVIQHVPFEEQRVVIRKIRKLLKSGGYVIMLESTLENQEEPYIFPRVIDDWVKMFEDSGFRSIALQRYSYNLFFRLGSRLASMSRPHRSSRKELSLEEMAAIPEPRRGRSHNFAKRLVTELDATAEPILARRNVAFPSSDNCGFLFQAI